MSSEPQYSIIEDIEIEPVIQNKWKNILNLITGIINIPVALVMRAHREEIEVFVKSSNEENLYEQAKRARLSTGLYCEAVMASRRMLNIPNALKDENWRSNPDISLGMIAYLGFPILWPNGEVFGTICVLDNKEKEFTVQDERIMSRFAEILSDDLSALIDRIRLREESEEHERYEAELRLSEERFRKIFHSSSSAIIIFTHDGKIIDVNESFKVLFGMATESIAGKSYASLDMYLSAEQQSRMLDLFMQGSLTNYSLNIKTPAGKHSHLLVSADRITIANQDCIICTINDITFITQLEQSLQTANERFELAAHAAELGVWDWDLKTEKLLLDAQAARIYGLSAEALVTDYETWLACLYSEDTARCEAVISGAIETCQPLDIEYRVNRPDGTVRFIRSFGSVICGMDGLPVRMVGVNLDITEKKLADIALQQSEARLRHAQALAHVGNWEIDLNTRQMWASMEAYRIYGIPYGNGYIPLETAKGVVTDQDRPMMDLALARLIQKKAEYDVVFHIHRQEDGEVRILHSIADCQFGTEGEALRVTGVVQDITDIVRAQERIVESEAKYKALFNETSAAHMIMDVETGQVVDANIAAKKFYGYPGDRLIGMYLTDLSILPPEELHNRLNISYARQHNHFFGSHRLANGDIREVEVFNGPTIIGGRRCITSIVHDITDRKRAECELVESEARFRMFVENAPDSVFVQTNSCFAYVNHKTIELYGAKSEHELIGRNVPETFAEDCRAKVIDRIKTLNEVGKAVPLREEVILRMDGSHLEVEASAVPIRYNGQDGALVFMRDITERRRMESERMEMEMQLQQKQRLESIGLLAGGVAHEINNPLSGIINYAQLISESPPEAAGEYSREIVHEGQRIAEIIRNLLKFSRHEKQSHSPAQIEDIIGETLSLIRTIMRHDQIALEINVPPGLPSLKCRSQQIQQVLMNLFTNARDALNARYPGFDEDKVIRLDCEMFNREGRRWIRITVEDHGMGISREIRDRIFDPFFTTKRRGEGTGLGLSISHGIVKDHHGELYFESEPDRFTRAILELPVDNGWNINGGTSHA